MRYIKIIVNGQVQQNMILKIDGDIKSTVPVDIKNRDYKEFIDSGAELEEAE